MDYKTIVSLAVGLASQFFSPLTVAMLAINPLIQAPLLAWLLHWSNKHIPVIPVPMGDSKPRNE